MLRFGPPLAIMLMAVLTACVSFGIPHLCEPELVGHLNSLGIPQSRITDLTIRTEQTGQKGRTTGHTAWVRLDSCEGHLIVEMNRGCAYRRAYFNNSNCRLPRNDQNG